MRILLKTTRFQHELQGLSGEMVAHDTGLVQAELADGLQAQAWGGISQKTGSGGAGK